MASVAAASAMATIDAVSAAVSATTTPISTAESETTTPIRPDVPMVGMTTPRARRSRAMRQLSREAKSDDDDSDDSDMPGFVDASDTDDTDTDESDWTDDGEECESDHEYTVLRWRQPQTFERDASRDPIVDKLGRMEWKVPVGRADIPSADTGPAQKPSFEPEVIRMAKEGDYLGLFLNALPIIMFFARVLVPQVCLRFVHVVCVTCFCTN